MLSVTRPQESSAAAALPAAARRRRSSLVLQEVVQRVGERDGVAGRREPPGLAVAQHGAVAGQVGGDHRNAGGHRLGQHDAEALGGQRRRADDLRRRQVGDLLLVGDPAESLYPGEVHRQPGAVAVGLEHLPARGARDDQRRVRGALAQERERLQQHAEPLPALGAPHEQDPAVHLGRAHGRGVVLHGDPVRDDPVRPGEPALRERPRRLAHGDAHVEAPHHHRHKGLQVVVERRVVESRVEGADHRTRRHHHRHARHHRRGRLVHVQHVEAAVADGAVHAREDLRREVHVGDRAVARERHGRAHGDEALGHRLAPAVDRAPRRRHGAHRRDDPGLVTALLELLGEVLDVVVHTAGDGPGVRGDEAYAHPAPLFSARPCRAGTGSRGPRGSPAAASRASRAGEPRRAR